jgi:putative FmdB family regulatory protein
MPIYEFYCRACHTIYSFLARTAQDDPQPKCPRCGRQQLNRQMSRFAISKGRPEQEPEGEEAGDPFAGMDEEKMERVMEEMAGDIENVNEDDPRAMAQMMRRMFDATGVEPNSEIQEAIRRMEAGEDPDKIDEEMGDVLESADPFSPASGAHGVQRRLRRFLEPPNVDPELYDL